MGIKIDVTHTSDDLKSTIQDAIKRKYTSENQVNNRVGKYGWIRLYDENVRQKVKRFLDIY